MFKDKSIDELLSQSYPRRLVYSNYINLPQAKFLKRHKYMESEDKCEILIQPLQQIYWSSVQLRSQECLNPLLPLHPAKKNISNLECFESV